MNPEDHGTEENSIVTDFSDDSKGYASADDRMGEHAYSRHFPKSDNEYKPLIALEIKKQIG